MKIACVGLLLGSFATAANGQTVPEVVGNNTDLSTLYTALETAGLIDGLSTDEVTLFAPVNQAFEALDPTVLEALLTPPYLSHLQVFLAEHVVPGIVMASNITDGSTLDTLSGQISFMTTEEGVFAGGASFNDSQIVEADILASNGVVHTVSQVFLPTVLVNTIWDNLNAQPTGFEIVISAIEQANLDEALDGPEPLTIFAPTDAVFETLNDEDLAKLNMTEVLLNHAVAGVYPTSLLVDGAVVTTVLGLNYTVEVDGETVKIGGIPVTQANLVSSNGILHAIGGLLLPPTEGQAPVAPPTIPPVMAPTEGTPAPTIAPAESGNVFTPSPTTSSASMIRSGVAVVAALATVFLW